jgi:hypothetical protein
MTIVIAAARRAHVFNQSGNCSGMISTSSVLAAISLKLASPVALQQVRHDLLEDPG